MSRTTPATVDRDGMFSGGGSPGGASILSWRGDLDGDDQSDVRQIVQIPAGEDGETGRLDDVEVDPLSTLVVEEFRALLNETGADLGELDLSPTAVIRRVVQAYVHLFEDTGD